MKCKCKCKKFFERGRKKYNEKANIQSITKEQWEDHYKCNQKQDCYIYKNIIWAKSLLGKPLQRVRRKKQVEKRIMVNQGKVY